MCQFNLPFNVKVFVQFKQWNDFFSAMILGYTERKSRFVCFTKQQAGNFWQPRTSFTSWLCILILIKLRCFQTFFAKRQTKWSANSSHGQSICSTWSIYLQAKFRVRIVASRHLLKGNKYAQSVKICLYLSPRTGYFPSPSTTIAEISLSGWAEPSSHREEGRIGVSKESTWPEWKMTKEGERGTGETRGKATETNGIFTSDYIESVLPPING